MGSKKPKGEEMRISYLALLFVIVMVFVVMLATSRQQGETKYGKFISVEESCPNLHRLGLRGEMEVREGLMFLENKVKNIKEKTLQAEEKSVR